MAARLTHSINYPPSTINSNETDARWPGGGLQPRYQWVRFSPVSLFRQGRWCGLSSGAQAAGSLAGFCVFRTWVL